MLRVRTGVFLRAHGATAHATFWPATPIVTGPAIAHPVRAVWPIRSCGGRRPSLGALPDDVREYVLHEGLVDEVCASANKQHGQ